MKNNHKSAKLDALLGYTVEIQFFDGSTERGILYDRETAQDIVDHILGNTPYFIISPIGYTFGFYKTHVKKIKYNGAIEIKGDGNG